MHHNFAGVRRARLAALALVVVACVPATASAALPTFRGHTIVPGRSIGGASIGMSPSKAIATWGGNPDCPVSPALATCEWDSPSNEGSAVLYFAAGHVVDIDIQVTNAGGPIYKGPLLRLKTAKKIGLGSTTSATLKAYPKVQFTGSGIMLGSGNHAMYAATSSSRLYDIYVGRALG
jgi:hypothetical protein